MNQSEKQKILTRNLQIVYDEYSAYVYHLIALKPFFKDMIDISKGKNPNFDLSEIIQIKKIK